MKLFSTTAKQLVIISLHDSYIACAVINQSPDKNPLQLTAYKYVRLTKSEITDGHIHNVSAIVRTIQSFLQRHSIQSPFVTFALSGSLISDQFIEVATADFIPTARQHYVMRAIYLYPHAHQGFIFYESAIPESTILQCKMIAHLIDAYVLNIMTVPMAILYGYKKIFGTVHRTARLYDQLHNNNNIEQLFSKDLLHRIITTKSVINAQDVTPLAAACGHFLYEKDRI